MLRVDMPPPRRRAKQACLACNARRVKCNVTERKPCHNCIAASLICETRESRRGKHPRRSRQSKPTTSEDLPSSSANDIQPHQTCPTTHSNGRRRESEVAASHVLASLSAINAVIQDDYRQELDEESRGVSQNRQHERDSCDASQDDRQKEDDGAVFLGESSSLRHVSTHHSNRSRHLVPSAARAEALIPEWEAERRRSRISFLRADGAFALPATAVWESLLKAYFRWFHPCFAIVDETDTWTLFRQGNLSPLLLQAILFIGAIHCDEVALDSQELGNRHRAKYLLYNRAKDIYDADFESRKMTVVQALFLMSFWRAGALLEKDVRHWLGTAISLAQTKAFHRSAGNSDPQTYRLQKRLWWSIYTREKQCAAALGLPIRIRDEDCDIEPLTYSDFTYAFDTSSSKSDDYIAYAIGMAELARVLGLIVNNEYLPNRKMTSAQRNRIRDDLSKWKHQLPLSMAFNSETRGHLSFHARMLHLAYNNLLTLLHRSGYINNVDESDVDNEITLQSATSSSRIIEDMLSEGHVQHAQIHVITNLFNTLCIHVIHLQRSSGTTRAVAEHRAKLCLLGLQELQRTWEVTNWVLQLFFQYLDRSTAARLRMSDLDEAANKPDVSSYIGQSSSDMVSSSYHDDTSFATPLSWTTEEAHNYLLNQIENNFPFGEGGVRIDWGSDNVFSGGVLQSIEASSEFTQAHF